MAMGRVSMNGDGGVSMMMRQSCMTLAVPLRGRAHRQWGCRWGVKHVESGVHNAT